ncbi:MAG: site-specific integrase [Planctomycetes bacterium]|nr:site-specific integrase [Planctomycetota bacterium]
MRIWRPQATRSIPADATIDRERGIVTYKAHGKTRRAVLTVTENGERMRVETNTWHIEFRDHLRRKQSFPAFTHEGQTRLLASQIEKLIPFPGQALPADLKDYCEKLPSGIIGALQGCGLLESEQTPIAKPLSELVTMYEQALRTKERSKCHIERTIADLDEICEGCAFGFWRDIKREKLDAYLKGRRDGAVLRMNRHDKDGHPVGIGYTRSNAYITAVVAFCNWVVDERKWARESPMRGIKKLDAKQDARHVRRALTVEQLRTLLQKTAEGAARYGMGGWERYLLYRTATESGLRAGELRRLRKADFDFDGGTVTVRAVKATKSRRTKQQALSPGLCAELRDFLASKLPDAKAFGGSFTALTDKTSDMLQEDLAAAGIRYKDDMETCFDFHALRGETASLLIDSGVDPKLAQDIMRHSSIGLTMDVYAKIIGGRKKAQAVASLPDLSLPSLQAEVVVRTGTDDVRSPTKLLRDCCSQDEKDRTRPDSIGQVTHDGAIKTAFPIQNKGSVGIVVPRVEGSNPFSHPSWRACDGCGSPGPGRVPCETDAKAVSPRIGGEVHRLRSTGR